MKNLPLALVAPCLAIVGSFAVQAAEVRFDVQPRQVVVRVGDRPLATYVHRDEKISRPYFAHLHAPGGIQVSRNHPTVEGQDATDHATFHPGLWMAFGDLDGHDYWRLKARVQHDGFIAEPRAEDDRGSFTVRNLYWSQDGKRQVCVEICKLSFLVRPGGYLIQCPA